MSPVSGKQTVVEQDDVTRPRQSLFNHLRFVTMGEPSLVFMGPLPDDLFRPLVHDEESVNVSRIDKDIARPESLHGRKGRSRYSGALPALFQ